MRASGTPRNLGGPDLSAPRAESQAEEIGFRLILPCLYELRARAAASAGDTAGTETALRHAQRLFREMGALLHVERLAKRLDA